MRFKPQIAAGLILAATALVLISSPLIVGYIYDVPAWFLWPNLPSSSLLPESRTMNITIDPIVPLSLGDCITANVIDSDNGLPIEGVTVEVSKDGSDFAPILTDETGAATFEYPGEGTIIKFIKEDYISVNRVIPKIPDQWVRADATEWIFNVVTLALGLSSTSIVVIKFKSSFALQKKKRKPRTRRKTKKFNPKTKPDYVC